MQTSSAVSGWGVCQCDATTPADQLLVPETWFETDGRCNASLCNDGVTLALQATIRTPDIAKHYFLLRDTTVHREVAYGSGGVISSGPSDRYTLELTFDGKLEPGHSYDFISITWLDGPGICTPSTLAARVPLGTVPNDSRTLALSVDASAPIAGACTLAHFW